jgi:hypothetical protein
MKPLFSLSNFFSIFQKLTTLTTKNKQKKMNQGFNQMKKPNLGGTPNTSIGGMNNNVMQKGPGLNGMNPSMPG